MTRRLSFRHLLTPAGIETDRTVVVSDDGSIEAIEAMTETPVYDGYFALPGMPNAHSHVFQRALAGFGEAAVGEGSFWGWREAMYRLANALSPEELYAVARHGFSEMLGAGFTRVVEFHYLHHRRDGSSGPEMASAVLEAAESVGLPLLFLPVYYRTGGFGTPPRPEQRRFIHESPDDFLSLVDRILAAHPTRGSDAASDLAFGVAPHSLRAAPVEEIGDLLDAAESLLGPGFPVHIHVSEQRREVEECRAALGATPISMLAAHLELGPRWSLVHATHATPEELEAIRGADATVVLCPLTEAYLGDGLFPADEHVKAGGRIAVGTDSNVRIDAVGELRCLEYGQRLRTERRARLATGEGLGAPLWRLSAEGGARAADCAGGTLEPGGRADLIVLSETDPALAGHGPETVLDAWLVGGDRTAIRSVYIGGRRAMHDGEVAGGEGAGEAFARVVAGLRSS